jgi:hypothetical protein
MDLFNETRSLVHFGPVLRRGRSDTGFTTGWSELVAALLDNYCKLPRASGSAFRYLLLSSFLVVILMREEKCPNDVIRRVLVSRVHIDFLILPFNLMPAYSQYHYHTFV